MNFVWANRNLVLKSDIMLTPLTSIGLQVFKSYSF